MAVAGSCIAHILAIGVDEVTWKQLDAALKNSGTAKPLRAETAARPRQKVNGCPAFEGPGSDRLKLLIHTIRGFLRQGQGDPAAT